MEFRLKKQGFEKLRTWLNSKHYGRPDDFAKQLGLSCRTLRRWIQEIEHELNVKIDYDRTQQCYTVVSDDVAPIKQ